MEILFFFVLNIFYWWRNSQVIFINKNRKLCCSSRDLEIRNLSRISTHIDNIDLIFHKNFKQLFYNSILTNKNYGWNLKWFLNKTMEFQLKPGIAKKGWMLHFQDKRHGELKSSLDVSSRGRERHTVLARIL